jgi:hypothetical protein
VRLLTRMMCFKKRSIKEVGQATHEGVPEAAEMNVVLHFFSENVCWICLAGNMLDGFCLALNPFANRFLVQFNVPSHLRSHAVGPLDAGFIIIVHKGRLNNIQNRKTKIANTSTNIT